MALGNNVGAISTNINDNGANVNKLNENQYQ